MVTDADDEFYNRAEAVIHWANAQLEPASLDKVSASCTLWHSALQAWVTVCGFDTGAELADAAKKQWSIS